MTDLAGKRIILVTGATVGIGEATALKLAIGGDHIIVHGRSNESCQAVLQRILAEYPRASLDFLAANFSSLSQVKDMCRTLKERYNRLDVLINNAGAFFMKHQVSEDNVEMTMAVNHLAHFLLTLNILPLLQKSPEPRIVNVSSNAHHQWSHDNPGKLLNPGKYNSFAAYGNSKLANVLFTYELARRMEGSTITVNALHPGFVVSRIGMNNGWLISTALKIQQRLNFFKQKTTEEGARTSVYLATSPEVSGISGKYFVDCQPVPSAPASYDRDLARELWDWSSQVTGIDLPELAV